jgi:hypothetical protein
MKLTLEAASLPIPLAGEGRGEGAACALRRMPPHPNRLPLPGAREPRSAFHASRVTLRRHGKLR